MSCDIFLSYFLNKNDKILCSYDNDDDLYKFLYSL